MQKTYHALYRVLCHTAIIFTAIIIAFAAAMNPIDQAAAQTADSALAKGVIFTFLKFSFAIGLASLLYLIEKWPGIIVQILHFIASCAAFVIFVLPAGGKTSSSQIFVAIFAFMIVYWVIFGVIKLIKLPLRSGE